MVDIAIYRCRIGTFFCLKQPRLFECKRRFLSFEKPKCLLILFSITLCAVLTQQLHSKQHTHFKGSIHFLYKVNVLSWSSLSFKSSEILDHNFLAKYRFGNKGQQGIRILHWNKGPSFLENKKDELETVIKHYKPHIFGVSEANFFKHHDKEKVQIPEYTMYTCPTLQNDDLKVSRVVVYAHNSVIVTPRTDLMNEKVSAIWLEVGLPHKRKILICNMYREWGYLNQSDKTSHSLRAQFERWQIVIENWERALQEGREVVLLGDININSLKWMKDNLSAGDTTHKLRPLIDLLFEKIVPFGVSQLVTTPTHHDSCLDHLYSNKPEKLVDTVALYNGGSDHKMIYTVRYAKDINRKTRYMRKRQFKNFDVESFKSDIHAQKWLDIYMSTDVDSAVAKLTNKVTTILDRYAPVRTIQVRKHYAPWLSDETKHLMQQRNRAQQTYLKSQDIDKAREYRNLRNQVTNMIRRDKREWETSRLDHLVNSSNNLWKNIKGILCFKSCGPPQQLFHEGKLVGSPKELVEVMNHYFIDKVNALQARLPPQINDPLKYMKNMMKNRKCSFSFKSVHPDDVKRIVMGLKNTKSVGLDDLDVHTIKLIIDDILPSLTHIINLSLDSSVFPDLWKSAKIIPLLKKGDPLSAKNYRPVALLPILSKILEKVVFKQIVNYMETNKLIHPSHHGSRAKHNTCTAVLEMYSTWVDSFERGETTGIMMLDLSAAFDLVNHELLVKKLELMGFDKSALNWFKSYLSGRSQCVHIDGQTSKLRHISVGVPQGSVLGALMYILFVNDLPSVIHEHDHITSDTAEEHALSGQHNECSCCGLLCAYVDDSTYSYSCTDPSELNQRLNTMYRTLATYFSDNRLVINGDKTKLIVVEHGKYGNARDNILVDTGTTIITPSESGRLLGINIHESLKWKDHILSGENALIKCLSLRLNAVKRISSISSFKTRLMVANACFQSVLVYMIVIWGGSEKYLTRAAQVIQNKVARHVTKLTWFTPIRSLLKQCNWLSIQQLIFFHTALQMWKVRTDNAPGFLKNRFELTNTRSRQDGALLIPAVSTSLGRKSFPVRAAAVWNQSPADIRNLKSLQTFKQKLKSWTMDNIAIE